MGAPGYAYFYCSISIQYQRAWYTFAKAILHLFAKHGYLHSNCHLTVCTWVNLKWFFFTNGLPHHKIAYDIILYMVDYDKTHECNTHVIRCGQAVGQAASPQGMPKPKLDTWSTTHGYCNVNCCWLTPLHNVDTLWEMKIRFWLEENKCNFPFKQHINSKFPSVKPHAIDKAQFARY